MAAGDLGSGDSILRKEFVDTIIKAGVLQKEVLKDVFMIKPVDSDNVSYYTETGTFMTAAGHIGRLAGFPVDFLTHTKSTQYLRKAGLETEISWEDENSDNIDMITRSLLKVAASVAHVVNVGMYNAISDATGIAGTVTIPTTGDGWNWDSATRAGRNPADQIARAISLVEENNYEADTILVNPYDFGYMISNANLSGAYEAASPANIRSGRMGQLLGLNVIKSNSVRQDEAIVMASKLAGTYAVGKSLATEIIDNPGISKVIRAWEWGIAYITDPLAIAKISNTKT